MTKLNVFVACPYSLFPLDDYKKVFQGISKTHAITFKFADEQITSEHVLEKIKKYILEADFSLFDITGWNPNVSLELGLCVGLKKKYFILLNNNIENKDAPSDIKGIDRIQYSSNSILETKLLLLMKQEMRDDHEDSDTAFERLKSRVLIVLQNNPGLGLGNLAKNLKEDKYLVQSVVRSMAQNGELKTTGAKRGTVYFTPDTDLRKHRKRINS